MFDPLWFYLWWFRLRLWLKFHFYEKNQRRFRKKTSIWISIPMKSQWVPWNCNEYLMFFPPICCLHQAQFLSHGHGDIYHQGQFLRRHFTCDLVMRRWWFYTYSQRRPVGRDFPAYCIWKLAKFGWYPGFWLRGLWVGVLNLSQLTPPVSRKSYRDNRWIIFHLLNSAYCIRVPDGLNCPRSQ